jgi:hypothetical protein
MSERHLRVVGPEGQELFETTFDSSHVVSVVHVTPGQDPSLANSEVWIRVHEANEEQEDPAASRSITDPNTGERIAHPSLQEHDRRPPPQVDRPATRGDGRLREYLRLVEGP